MKINSRILNFILSATAFGLASSSFGDPANSAEKLMDDWLNLEIQKGQLESSWAEREQELEQRLTLMDVELRRLREIADQRVEASSEVDQRREELLEKQERLEQEQENLQQQLDRTSRAANFLLKRLPPPLQAQWTPQLAEIAAADVNNNEKLEGLLALFKMAAEFDRRIALHKGELQVATDKQDRGKVIIVNQIYMGLSQGWYISDDGEVYGYGRSTRDGWKWWAGEKATTELGLALHPSEIIKTYQILQNPTTANFVSLPVKIN